MKITFQAPPKNLDEKMLYNILRDYKILNCEVLVRDENGTDPLPLTRTLPFFLLVKNRMMLIKATIPATVDDFIDVIMKDHRKYIKWYTPPFPTPFTIILPKRN